MSRLLQLDGLLRELRAALRRIVEAVLGDQGGALLRDHRLLATVGVVLGLIVLRAVLVRLVNRRMDDARRRFRWSKAVDYGAFIAALIIVALIWAGGVTGVAAYLGLLSAGIAIALREPLTNIVGWGLIVLRRPFAVGDRIEVGTLRGDVVDQSLFNFYVLEVGNWVQADQSTGRVVVVPNSVVFIENVANYDLEFPLIWDELPVVVTFESDWQRAKELLREIGERQANDLAEEARMHLRSVRRFLIDYQALTPIVYTSVVDHGVQLTLRFLARPRGRRIIKEAVWEDLLRALADEPTIDFAYPTRRNYNNVLEGKPGAGGPNPSASDVQGGLT